MPIPTAVSESTITIADLQIRVYVLDNGQRIVNADDAHRLFAAIAEGRIGPGDELERAYAAICGQIN